MLIALLQCLSDFSVDHPWWTSLLVVLITAHISKWIKSRRYRLPPGPTGLPIVGYLPFLSHNLHEDLTKLQRTYGGVFSMKLGSRYTVVIGDSKSIKEANVKEEFASRPPGFFNINSKIKHLENQNLKDWKESRRFMLSTLRTLGMGKNKVEEVIQNNISLVLEHLDATTGRTEVNLHSHLYDAVTNTIVQLICGKTVGTNLTLNSDVVSFSRNISEYFHSTSIAYFLPVLKPFLAYLPSIKLIKEELDKMEKLFWKEIENHEKVFDESNLEDYMDHFIQEIKKRKIDPSTFTKSTLNGNSQLLLTAGSDTIRTTIEWTLLLMAKHQDIQARAYAEIVDVLGKEKLPSWNDRDRLPYLDSIIMEVSRIKSISPLGSPKWTSADTVVNQYDIPKGTFIINNFHAVHMDPDLWDHPEEFNPDRFLQEDGTKTKHVEGLMPFGYGQRICPGEQLASVSVFLYVASILQKFRLLPPPSGLNMSEKITLVIYPKSPFVKVERRDNWEILGNETS